MFCLAKKDMSRENKLRWRGKKREVAEQPRRKELNVVEGGGGWLQHAGGTGYQCCRGMARRANTVAAIRLSCSCFSASQTLQSIMYSE